MCGKYFLHTRNCHLLFGLTSRSPAFKTLPGEKAWKEMFLPEIFLCRWIAQVFALKTHLHNGVKEETFFVHLDPFQKALDLPHHFRRHH